MNLLGVLISLCLLVSVFVEAFFFYQATVCRQKTWLKAVEKITSAHLPGSNNTPSGWVQGCRIALVRNGDQVSWSKGSLRLPIQGNI